jgi:hypothetical protein
MKVAIRFETATPTMNVGISTLLIFGPVPVPLGNEAILSKKDFELPSHKRNNQ